MMPADNMLNALAPVDRACLEQQRPEHLAETVPGGHSTLLRQCLRPPHDKPLRPLTASKHSLPCQSPTPTAC